MKITAGKVAEICGGRLLCGSPETEICSVATDSRKLGDRTLFVPIRGERVDAHIFIEKTLESGAAAALTQEHSAASGEKPWIAVRDTREALQKIAAAYRAQFSMPVIGITGSVGKTTTKEMVALALSGGRNVMKTEGNLNSQIGLPLTMFRLSDEYDAAVIEMGMSDFGEMARLAAIAAPQYAVMTNIGISHLENLKTQENIRAEKLHITDRFTEQSILFLNGDDPLLKPLSGKFSFRTVTFGMGEECHYRASGIRTDGDGTAFLLTTPDGNRQEIRIPCLGDHNVRNALAAVAVSDALGVDRGASVSALAGYEPPAMRQQIRRGNGITVLDDSYNASPDSVKSSLNVLRSLECAGKRGAVLADMLELGDLSEQAHYETGREAARSGMDFLVTVGKRAEAIARGALDENPSLLCRVCSENAEAIQALREIMEEGDDVLVKGSRSMKTDEIVSALLSEKGIE